MQVMSGSHWMIRHTRTTVLWPWRTLVKTIILPCSAWLTSLLVADNLNLGLSQETGTSPIKLESPVETQSGTFIELEVRWWYVWTAEEVEWKGSTTVTYLIQRMLPRPYTLECTTQALVRNKVILEFRVWVWVSSSTWDLSSVWHFLCSLRLIEFYL